MNEQEKQALTDEIVNRLANEGAIRKLLPGLNDEDYAFIAEKSSPHMWANIPTNALRKIKRAAPMRFLLGDADINEDENGVEVGHAGPTLPDIVNIHGGTAWLTTGDGRELNLRVGGGGADCMFDYLVSPCLAQAIIDFPGRYSEGMELPTSIPGCTFKVYSTVQGAATAIGSGGADAVLFICGGDYLENVLFTGPASFEVTIIAAGRDRVSITGQTSAGITLGWTSATTTLRLSNFTINAHSSSGAIGLGPSGVTNTTGGSLHNMRISSSSNAAGIGFDPGVSAGWIAEDCLISGSGIGITDGAGGDSSNVWSAVKLVNCQISAAVGARFVNDSNLTMIGGGFSGAIGIQNNSIFTSTRVRFDGVDFSCATAGVQCSSSGGFDNAEWIGCHFINCDKAFDYGTLANVSDHNRIEACHFVTNTGTDIGIDDTAGALRQSIIKGNTFTGYNAGNEVFGRTEAQLRASNVQVTHNETDSGTPVVDSGKGHTAGGGTAAPSDVDYLVGTADADLSNEIVVGTTPGGELGGTWAAPTVDATHSGSAHHTRGHAMLDGGTDHTDSAADAVTRGSIIVGNATPAWDELAIGAAETILSSDGSDATWRAHFITQIIPFTAPAEDLAAGVFIGNPGICVGEAGEHGTLSLIRAKAFCGTVGAGTNTILIEADDSPAFTTPTVIYTLALDASQEVDDTTQDNTWVTTDNFIRARCTAVGATAPKNVMAQVFMKQQAEAF